MKKYLSTAAAIAMLALAPAQASVLTFEGIPQTNTNTFSTGGFTFAMSQHFFHMDPNGTNGWALNGTETVGVHRNYGPAVDVTMTSGAGPFSIQSIDLGEYYIRNGARTVEVLGNLAGGGTVSTSFTLDGVADGNGGIADFQTFAFGNAWQNLSSVVFSNGEVSNLESSWSFDNISVNNAAAVPEPGSLALAALALGLIALPRRRRNK